MKKLWIFGNLFALLFIATFVSCKNDQPNLESNRSELNVIPNNVSDSIQFQIVKNYIKKNGEHTSVNTSGIAGNSSKWMIDYYSINREKWNITIDHSNRIYFRLDSTSYGNILFENGRTSVEPYYLGRQENIDTINSIRNPINALYRKIFNQAVIE